MRTQKYLIGLLLVALFTINLNAAIAVRKVWQPEPGLAPQKARLNFLQFMLLSDTTERVDGITIKADTMNSSDYRVFLLENGFGDIVGKINTENNQNTPFMPLSIIVKAGEPVYLTLQADMGRLISSTYDGTTIGADVIAIWTEAEISGSFPLVGARHTFNSLRIGGINSVGRKGPHQNITAGENQVLGSIEVTTSYSENLLMYGLPVDIHSTGGDPTQIKNLVAVDQNGAVIASSQGPLTLRKEYEYAKFVLYAEKGGIVLSKGTSVISFRGDTTEAFSRGGTIAVATNPSEWNVHGVLYGYKSAVSDLGSVLSATRFVRVPRLDVQTVSPQYAEVQPGVAQVQVFQILLDATQSSEDIRVTALSLIVVALPGWASDLAQYTLYDGSQTVGWNYSPTPFKSNTANLTFQMSDFFVPKGTKKVLTLKVDISQKASGLYGIGFGKEITAVGLQSGKNPAIHITPGYTILVSSYGRAEFR